MNTAFLVENITDKAICERHTGRPLLPNVKYAVFEKICVNCGYMEYDQEERY